MILVRVLLGIMIINVCFCFLLLAKNNNTYRNMTIIAEAIHKFNLAQIEAVTNPVYVGFDHMISYDKALWRLWDWGYENILTKEAFEKIKPYIDE